MKKYKVICNRCKKRPAAVHIKKIEDGKKIELDLCPSCASEITPPSSGGLFGFQENFFDSISDILAGFSDTYDEEIGDSEKCSRCGTAFSDFQKSGRMGCSECYDSFSDKLLPLLKRLQGSIQHAGKSPLGQTRKQEIIRLQAELQRAVKDEEYERAAVIRDKIKELEKKKDNETS